MRLFLIFPFLFLFQMASAQYGLDGFWAGEIITKDGIFRIELILEIDDYSWKSTGMTIIYKNGEVVEKRIFEGRLYQDRSIGLEELPLEQNDSAFIRKYQLLLERSAEGAILKGFWQEIITDPMATKRQIGQLTLHKQKDTGA